MAPTRSKTQKMTDPTISAEFMDFPAPPRMIPTKTRSRQGTPSNRSPIKKAKIGFTVAQKQALIDNLQLEITERARKLRAQYNLQAQGLRSRIEIRVNRIPTALRKTKMGDLLIKHSQATKQITNSPSRIEKSRSPHKNLIQEGQSYTRASPSPQRGAKRFSDDISIDKENENIENPKKKPRGEAPIPIARTTSKMQASQVLSPRSANSRTLPRSPIRPLSPQKSFLARPISPLKPAAQVPSSGASGILNNMVEKAKSTRNAAVRKATTAKEPVGTATGAGRGRRAVATQAPQEVKPKVGKGRASTSSDSSDASAGTVVRKPVAAPAAKKAAVKKSVMSTIKGMGSQKKAPVATKSATATAPAGGRVLRKRN